MYARKNAQHAKNYAYYAKKGASFFHVLVSKKYAVFFLMKATLRYILCQKRWILWKYLCIVCQKVIFVKKKVSYVLNNAYFAHILYIFRICISIFCQKIHIIQKKNVYYAKNDAYFAKKNPRYAKTEAY